MNSHLELMIKAAEFIKALDNDKYLFIVYYGGHGRINNERQAEWTCNRDPTYASVQWSAIQTLFAAAKSDVLILLDTCAAASATTRSQHGSMEAIMACGFESKAPPPGEHSFTNTLIDVLDGWINRRPFSASCLHAEILSQLKLKENKKGREGAKLEWCVTPIYINCTQDSKVPSIELCRRNILPLPMASPRESEPSPYVDAMDLDFDELHSSTLSSLSSLTLSGQYRIPHVLISVALEESQQELDVKKTTRWLESIPLLAKWAKVEGVFRSYSTLLLLSIPVPVWNMLPDHPACSFVGYVTSPNLVTPAEPSTKLEPVLVSTEDQNIKEELDEDNKEFFGSSSAPSLASQPWESPNFQQTLEALDPSVLAILDISNTARCSIYCRIQDEKTHVTYHKPATGRAQRDPQCDEDLLFQCGSLFKVFIAACLILIIDKLSSDPSTTTRYRKLKDAWNRPFTDVFNDLVDVQNSKIDPLPGEPSVLQMLLHYNGIYDINHILLSPDGTPLQGVQDVVDRISQYAKDTREQQAEGESPIIYSNANYILLALLIDKASGSLNKFLKEYIFEPFKMERTFLCLEDLYSHSNESQRQSHIISSNRNRRIFMPGITLGLSDIVELAWLGPYTSAADLGRFFEGLLSARDGEPIGLFDNVVVESLGFSRSRITRQARYTPYGLHTSLNSTGPGSYSLNRLISPDSNSKTYVLGKTSRGEEISTFYLAGSTTGWAGTVYFLPNKRTFVIVLTNTSGPLDASDLISRLFLQEIFDLRPPKTISWDVSNYLPSWSTVTSIEQYRAHYVILAGQMFDKNALKVKELEQLDNQPDTPTSDYPDLPGKYFCFRNGQYLHVINWKGEDNKKPEGVLRVVIQSGTKSSQKLRFTKKGKKFRICSPETSALAISCFDAWKNLEFEVERESTGVKSLSRQGVHLKDFFIREKR
jgi:CubicO group peptidase (beta-lactamase class C family)